MTHEVNLGIGKVSGMFFHSPTGTTSPASPFDELGEAWVEVGYVGEDGPSWTPYGDRTTIRDWSLTTRRQFQSERGKVTVPVISTSEESLKTVFGSGNVTTTAANAQHGNLVRVDTSTGPSGAIEQFLLIGMDDDDGIMLLCESGSVTEIAEVGLAPNGAIIWNITIDGNWVFVKDDGQTTGD